jgi:hypothetical protein
MRRLERDEVIADLGAVEALLGSLSESDVIGRMSLETRRDELRARLEALGDVPPPSAEAALFFGGPSVVQSRGIEATFASEALSTFEDLVATVWGNRRHGPLPMSGPIRDRDAARLHVTSTVHGSFGFRLEELAPQLMLGEAPLQDAVEEATRAIFAAGESEEALADAAEALDARAFVALRRFYDVLRRYRASFRLVTTTSDRSFRQEEVEFAAERTEQSQRDEEEIEADGIFRGVLPESRTFEFQVLGRTIKGRVDSSVDVDALNPTFANQRCIARLRIIRLVRRERTRERFVLVSIGALPPASSSHGFPAEE